MYEDKNVYCVPKKIAHVYEKNNDRNRQRNIKESKENVKKKENEAVACLTAGPTQFAVPFGEPSN